MGEWSTLATAVAGAARNERRGPLSACLAVAAALALQGCGPKTEEAAATTLEQTCSAQGTYDALTGIVAAQAGQAVSLLADSNEDAASAASKTAIGANLQYGSPTVQDVNKDTRKVSCEALLTVSVPPRMLSNNSLSVNDLGADKVTYQISYSVQPSADGGRPVYMLQQANDLSVVALTASLVALKKTQAAADVSRLDTSEMNASEPEADASAENMTDADAAEPETSDQPAPRPTNSTDTMMPNDGTTNTL